MAVEERPADSPLDVGAQRSTQFPEKAPDSQPKSNSPLASEVKAVSPEERAGNPDSSREMNGAAAADNSVKNEGMKEDSSSLKEGTGPSLHAGGEAEEGAAASAEEEPQLPISRGGIQAGMAESPATWEKQAPSCAAATGIEKESEISENAGRPTEGEATGPVAEQKLPDGITSRNDPAMENPDVLPSLPPVKKSTFRGFPSRKIKEEELKEKIVIPHYLAKGMVVAIGSEGATGSEDPQTNIGRAPKSPLLIFINSKSGGRLGPQLEALLTDLIAPTQVFDLSTCKPSNVLRHGLGYLEKQADAGDAIALETRNNIRIMVAGGDGTVGWVLGCVAEMGIKERYRVPPTAVIPLGTGNDLSRSFHWGGATTSVNRRIMKRWLIRAMEASIATLDSWEVVVTPARSCMDAPIKWPHAMHRQHHVPIENAGSGKDETEAPSAFEGSFWNYFSLGMDAQVAYGFHNLRDEAPWIAAGRISNQVVYGGYGCAQGWFCTPCATAPIARGIRQIAKVYLRRNEDVDAKWEELNLPSNIRAIVILNLQSYAGGRNPWGRPSARRQEKEGFVEAQYNDGILEIVGFRDGWHTAVVLLDWFTAVRLGQARAVRLELRGKGHRNKAYMQMDGEPWQQPLGEENDPPAVVEISCRPAQSVCLSRK